MLHLVCQDSRGFLSCQAFIKPIHFWGGREGDSQDVSDNCATDLGLPRLGLWIVEDMGMGVSTVLLAGCWKRATSSCTDVTDNDQERWTKHIPCWICWFQPHVFSMVLKTRPSEQPCCTVQLFLRPSNTKLTKPNIYDSYFGSFALRLLY